MAHYSWSNIVRSLEDVICNEEFPCTILVEKSSIQNVANKEIYRLDTYCNQTRYIVCDTSRNEYSIPENYPLCLSKDPPGDKVKRKWSSLENVMGIERLPQKFWVDPHRNANELRKYGERFEQLTFLEITDVPYAVVSQVDSRGCINAHMSAMSSQWPVMVRIADPSTTRLCRSCTHHLHDLEAKGIKARVLEPDLFILRMGRVAPPVKKAVTQKQKKKEKSSSKSSEQIRAPAKDKGMKKSQSVPNMDMKLHSRPGPRVSFRSDPGGRGERRHSGKVSCGSASGSYSRGIDCIHEEPNPAPGRSVSRAGTTSRAESDRYHQQYVQQSTGVSWESTRTSYPSSAVYMYSPANGKRTRSPPGQGSH